MKYTRFSPEVGDYICEQLLEGRSLQDICREEQMPAPGTIVKWLASEDEKFKDFQREYYVARKMQMELFSHELMEICNHEDKVERTPDGGYWMNAIKLNRDRLKVDTMKWLMTKIYREHYGDITRQELSGPNGRPIASAVVAVDAPRRDMSVEDWLRRHADKPGIIDASGMDTTGGATD